MRLTIQLYRDKAGKYRWRAVATNGNILADSGQGYVNKGHCERMARRLFEMPSVYTQSDSDSLTITWEDYI